MTYAARFALRNDFSPVAMHDLVLCSTIFYDAKKFSTSWNLGRSSYGRKKTGA
jgi:hypothetical protein